MDRSATRQAAFFVKTAQGPGVRFTDCSHTLQKPRCVTYRKTADLKIGGHLYPAVTASNQYLYHPSLPRVQQSVENPGDMQDNSRK